jgi:hypothetical protein
MANINISDLQPLNSGVKISLEQKTRLSLKVLSCKDFVQRCSS